MKKKRRSRGREEERRDTNVKSASQNQIPNFCLFSKTLLYVWAPLRVRLAAGSSDEARYQLEVTACPSKWQRNWSVKRQWDSLNTLNAPLMHC